MIQEPQNSLVSITILTWNRRRHVLKAIGSVFRQPYRPIEIVVVDSASTDGTVKTIRKNYPEVRIIKLHRNLGAVEGRNIALANCRGDIIFSLDDDALIWPSTVSLCVERFEKERKVGIIACQILTPETELSAADERYTYLFTGCGFAIKKKFLIQWVISLPIFFARRKKVIWLCEFLRKGIASFFSLKRLCIMKSHL